MSQGFDFDNFSLDMKVLYIIYYKKLCNVSKGRSERNSF